MTMEIVLGFDPSKTKLGWGAVREDNGAALRAGFSPLDGSPESWLAAMRDVSQWCRFYHLEPVFALVEFPFGGKGSAGIFDSGVAVGQCELAARLFFPAMTMDRIDSQRWRSKVGVPRPPAELPGRSAARRNWLKAADIARAQELGFDIPIVGARKRRPSDDAADGALIARAAWLALEAGDARRLSPERTAA